MKAAYLWVTDFAREARIEGVNPHRLGHSFLAQANDSSGDHRATMELAGQYSPSVTARYTRTLLSRLRDVREGVRYAQ